MTAVATGRIAEFCRRWNVEELALTGSMARGDFRNGSDVDLLVKFVPDSHHTFGDDMRMCEELQEMFGREVDLIEERGIVNPLRRHNMLLDKRVLYPSAETPVEQIRDSGSPFERDLTLVWDIVRSGRELVEGTRGQTFEDYLANRFLQLACERLLIIIGQASRALSEDFRRHYSDIPWHGIVSLRNVLVHNYPNVILEKVWKTITEDVPLLLDKLERLLPR